MLSEAIQKNSRAVSQLFQFLLVFGIDRFTILEINGQVIHARIGWPYDGSPDYDPNEETQKVSWEIDGDPLLDQALHLLHELAKNGQIDIDRIALREPEVRKLVSELNLPKRSLEKLLSVHVDMLDSGKKTDAFFIHF